MSRPFGSIVTTQTGRGISYGLRFSYRGRKQYEHFGGDWEGWTPDRVAQRRGYLQEKVRSGEYVPVPRARPLDEVETVALTFQQWASVWHQRKRPGWDDKTAANNEWRLQLAIGSALGNMPLDEIEPRHIARVRDELLAERARAQAAIKAGEPLYREVVLTTTGRMHRRVYRGQSPSTIKAVLAIVVRCLRDAVVEGLIESSPATPEATRVKVDKTEGSHLDPLQLAAVQTTARRLDRGRAGLTAEQVKAVRQSREPATRLAQRYGVSDVVIGRVRRGKYRRDGRELRRELVAQLLPLTGVRVSEACLLDHGMVDLGAGVIHVPRVKTDASIRAVPLLPAIHEALVETRAEDGGQPGTPVLRSRTGARVTRTHVEQRLSIVHRESATVLAEAGMGEIPHMTPHTFRRTFASIASYVGVAPRRCMELLGHTDPMFTMRVYAKSLAMSPDAILALERLMGCSVSDAREILEGRGTTGAFGQAPDKWRVATLFGDNGLAEQDVEKRPISR